jgi:hypothetical protein
VIAVYRRLLAIVPGQASETHLGLREHRKAGLHLLVSDIHS